MPKVEPYETPLIERCACLADDCGSNATRALHWTGDDIWAGWAACDEHAVTVERMMEKHYEGSHDG